MTDQDAYCNRAAADRFAFKDIAPASTRHTTCPELSRRRCYCAGATRYSRTCRRSTPTAECRGPAQALGYNNDCIAYFQLEESNAQSILCVNQEYTNEELMSPSLTKRQDTAGFRDMTAELVDIEMAAHGVSIVKTEKIA